MRVLPAPLKVLEIVSGFALLRWVLLLIARYLLGASARTSAALVGGRLKLTTEKRLLGRDTARTEEIVTASDLVSIGVETRFPRLVLLMGALGVLVGAMIGVGAVIDGIQASYVPLALFGLGVLAAGIVLDIGMGSLADYLGGRTSLLVQIRSGGASFSWSRRFRITGVDQQAAADFVSAAVESATSAP